MAEDDLQEIARVCIARLTADWDWPEPAILENIVALGEAAIPAIQDVLTPELLAAIHTDERASAIAYYLAEVLGEIGSPKAIPTVAALFRSVDDDTTENLLDIVERLGPEAVDPMLSVVADDALHWYPRAVASEAALNLAGADASRREHVAAGFRDILSRFLARTDPLSDEERDTVATVIGDLAQLADPAARPLIEAAFDADIVGRRPQEENLFWDIPIITRKGVDELYAEEYHEPLQPHPSFLEGYPERRRKHFEEVEKQRKTQALLHILEDAEPETVVLGPRLGRNDPCWCGSGKKYKKCHLADDEKLGR